MTKLERLKWLKEIEKDIHVCSLESTFVDDAKSCAIHSVIQELEQGIKIENQKPGHWIENKVQTKLCNCSECGALSKAYTKYCPHCGSKMEGEKE